MKIKNFFKNWFEETKFRRECNKKEKKHQKYIRIKDKHIKISKLEERNIKLISKVLEIVLIFVSFVLFLIYIVNILNPFGIIRKADQESIISNISAETIKNRAKIELISNSLKKVDIYILMNNESPLTIDYDIININGKWGNNEFLPFFYKREVAEDFKNNYLKIKNNSKVKIQKADLGFIYREYRTSPFPRDYLLLVQINKKWSGVNLNAIPVFYPKHIDDNVPFFLYQNNKLVAIPYFLDQVEAKNLTTKLGKKWKLSQNYLIKVIEQIPESDIGTSINIIPKN